ncbi:MAG: formylglycine-generating enzyme family protein [Actinobacteria bacterium]|nr:formylglycine-generating enzyme family protein [Actinomycetota bacterium]
MVRVPGGEYLMGSERHYPEEAPAHRVRVDGFSIDRHPVTNAEYAAFVTATGYETVAERQLDPVDYPGVPEELLVPGSLVFQGTSGPVPLDDPARWWAYVPGARWQEPLGPGADAGELADHPVVQVACEDAEAYAEWAGVSLPTEAEWEYAARGGIEGAAFTWGDEDVQDTEPLANTWQGGFPWQNSLLDGWLRTSPVGSYPPNGFGLSDMAGNVWEWTADWFGPRHPEDQARACCAPEKPRGARREESFDPAQPGIRIPRKVVKGGSHLCAPSYCLRYRPAARSAEMIDTATSHIGFRCVIRGSGGPKRS